MPVVEMLRIFKVAPMVGELTEGRLITFFATDTERKFNLVETAAEEMASAGAAHENQF